MAISRIAFVALSLALWAHSVSSLTCFENDEEGNVYERTNPDWKYCSLIPFASEGGKGRLAGVGEMSENTSGYQAVFGQSSKHYSVLSLCVFERYNFAAISRAFGPAPEFLFRCLCSTDKCNQETTFSAFLNHNRH